MKIRDIKIDLMLGNPNEIVDEFIRITDGIQIMNVPVYKNNGQEFIWYVGEKWIFYQDVKYDHFWCNYEEYWSIFESKFRLKYSDIQSITNFMVETAFKNVGTLDFVKGILHSQVETAFKNGVGTPCGRWRPLRMPVGTPFDQETVVIETAFKNGVGTPGLSGPDSPWR